MLPAYVSVDGTQAQSPRHCTVTGRHAGGGVPAGGLLVVVSVSVEFVFLTVALLELLKQSEITSLPMYTGACCAVTTARATVAEASPDVVHVSCVPGTSCT